MRAFSLSLTGRSIKRYFSSNTTKPWQEVMSSSDFEIMSNILHSPSPINMEASMTNYIQRETQKFCPDAWTFRKFKSNASLIVDTGSYSPQEHYKKLNVMVVGHADKIRMQVRHIGSDGKVYIDSESFLPLTLLGNEVTIFSQKKDLSGFNRIEGGTVESFGAIHFADPKLRSGDMGVKPEDIYIELGIHGEDKRKQVTEGLGIKPGDSVLAQRRIRKTLGRNAFTGSHLDNGLGCVTTFFLSRMIAELGMNENLRLMFTYCTHEEIGRFGSRQLVQEMEPDVVIAVDVNHDYVAAPNAGSKRFPEIEIGKGPTICIGSVCSPYLNKIMKKSAQDLDMNLQLDSRGADTGTDAMAGVLSNQDCVSASVGIPVRNMHTISELGVTDDVQAAVHLIYKTINTLGEKFDLRGREIFTETHPDLSKAEVITSIPESFFTKPA